MNRRPNQPLDRIYHYQELTRDSEGKEKSSRGRLTDILTKEDGKWLLLGDHGGPEFCEKE